MRNVLAIAAGLLACSSMFAQQAPAMAVTDKMEPLPAGKVQLAGYFDKDIHNSIDNWVKGVMPYDAVIEWFRTGRQKFALGEMPGKAIRNNALLYRYTQDPEIKELTRKVTYSFIATAKSNGSLSCTPVEEQPGNRDGDIWERKYTLIGLTQYLMDIENDPKVLEAAEKEAKSVMDQVGPAPKKPITELGWSSNNIESSSILEPFVRLYELTGKQEYLDYAKYIIDCGGGKGVNMFDQVLEGKHLFEVGAPYPKAYEMTSLWEGLAEYYRVTGDPKWLECLDRFFDEVRTRELTLIGNAGSDVYWPKLYGEGWSNTTYEQTNPDIKRMMETCVGVTWMKYCIQYLRLTGNPAAVDCIEKYIYNGLLGAMRPDGKGFSYVNLLNGPKVTNSGWGTNIGGLPVTCCNMNGPAGLAYIPYVAFMQSAEGPVVNLYNTAMANALTPSGKPVMVALSTKFPQSNEVNIAVKPETPEKFTVKLRIPSWSSCTLVEVNGKRVSGVVPGTYLSITRKWNKMDLINIRFDLHATLIPAPEGRNPEGKNFQAVEWGPIVLARDENIDSHYADAVEIVPSDEAKLYTTEYSFGDASYNGNSGSSSASSDRGTSGKASGLSASAAGVQLTVAEASAAVQPEAVRTVDVVLVKPERKGTRLEFLVPTKTGTIRMVDYSSVDCWEGKHIQTWLPLPSRSCETPAEAPGK